VGLKGVRFDGRAVRKSVEIMISRGEESALLEREADVGETIAPMERIAAVLALKVHSRKPGTSSSLFWACKCVPVKRKPKRTKRS